MKKFFAVTLAAIVMMAVAIPAMATTSRLYALGDVDNYVEDDANVFMWPATLPTYGDLVAMQLVNGEDYSWYGFTKHLGEYGDYGTFGIFFIEEMDGPNDVSEYETYWTPDWSNDDVYGSWLSNKWILMYGYEMEKMSLGLKFMRSSEKTTFESDDYDLEQSWSYTTIGASMRMDVNEETYFDFAIDYTMGSETDNYSSDFSEQVPEYEADACKKMEFRGRIFYEWTDMITWVPYIGLTMEEYNRSYDDDAYYNSDMYGMKAMSFDFGIAANMTVNEDNMIVMGIEPIRYAKAEPSEYDEDFDGSYEYTMMHMPRFVLGLESDIRDWLTFRTGCIKDTYSRKLVADDGTEEVTKKWDGTDFEWYLGLGFHVGDFDIDVVLDNEVPFYMGYWMTGFQPYDEGYAPMWMISALYHF